MSLGHKKGCFGPSDQGWSKMGEAGPSLALPPGHTALGDRPLWCSPDEWEADRGEPPVGVGCMVARQASGGWE